MSWLLSVSAKIGFQEGAEVVRRTVIRFNGPESTQTTSVGCDRFQQRWSAHSIRELHSARRDGVLGLQSATQGLRTEGSADDVALTNKHLFNGLS